MEEKKKRQGYKTKEQQKKANERYLKNNPHAIAKKTINSMRSNTKRFIKEYANNIELDELQVLIKERKGEIKMLENLKKLISEKADSIGELVNLLESRANALETEKIEAGIYKLYCENNIVIGLEIEEKQDKKALADGNDVRFYVITDIYQYKF